MGTIRADVRERQLKFKPDEEALLKPFLHGFWVTWGQRWKSYNTELSAYFLNPEPFMSEAFGFDQELLLIYSPYPAIEPRTFQAAEDALLHEPARGRVEKLSYFLISDCPEIEQRVRDYSAMNQESRLIIPFFSNELRAKAGDSWFVRNKIAEFLYGRDLFEIRLPLEKDTYFFGRSDMTVALVDAVKRSENKAVFGLRKTGKTSLLYKLERILTSENVAHVFYYDCKLPSIRKLGWSEFLKQITKDLAKRYKLPHEPANGEVKITDEFIRIVKQLSKPALLIFDEIEYISPVAIEDTHWHKEFVDFWQTFWACQSRHRKISAVIAGVNPSVVEMDTVSGIQNPLFGIVSYQYLTGLKPDESRNMLRILGKRMGLKFEPEAANYIHDWYGGHPLLMRMACSFTNNSIKEQGGTRPFTVSLERLKNEKEGRDADLMFYCRHVVSELKQFYNDEYEMLELLSSGQLHDFNELSPYPEYTKHLKSYGLMGSDQFKRPSVAIPVIGRYVALELAKKEGRQTLLRIVPKEERSVWLEKRKDSIATDLRLLEKAVQVAKTPLLFGANSYPEADQFARLKVVDSEDSFTGFINTCNRCFVESIESYGKAQGRDKYFWQEIKAAYPGLWHALHRIKIYRVEQLHLVLTNQASAELLKYLAQDLEGRPFGSVKDAYFILQQCVLDGLLSGIQVELSNLA